MSAHDHRVYVEGCYRYELSRDEVDPRFDVEPAGREDDRG